MELDSSELLKRFVAAGLGLGFLPRTNVAEDEQSGTLKTLSIEGVRLARELGLVFRKDKTLSRAAQAFLEIATGRPRFLRAAPAKIVPVSSRTRTLKPVAAQK
jgi:DNA-binding transcriptional LysR family regulator